MTKIISPEKILNLLKTKVSILVLTILATAMVSLTLAMGVRQTAYSYATESRAFPKDELPFLDSDNYKWALWLNSSGYEDPCEAKIDGKTPTIGWASLNKIYLQSLVSLAKTIYPTNALAAKNHALFFSMPILLILGGGILCAYSLYALNDKFSAILLPLLLAALPALHSQFYPGRPDHHGPIILCVTFFLLSLTQRIGDKRIGDVPKSKKSKSTESLEKEPLLGLVSGVSCGLALWLGPLNIIPLLGIVGLCVLTTKIESLSTNMVLGQSSFWKNWSVWVIIVTLLGWLLDYLPRKTFHMESLNPVWILSTAAGGLLLCQYLSKNPRPLKMLLLLGITLVGPSLCLSPKLFWTASEPIIWFHREVFEMLPGKLDEIFTLFPLGFLCLVLCALIPRLRVYCLIAGLSSLLYLWQVRWLPLALIPTVIVGLRAISLLGKDTKDQEESNADLVNFSKSALKTLIAWALILQTAWAATATTREGMDSWNYPRNMSETYRIPAFASVASKILKALPEGYIVGTPNLTTYLAYFAGRRGVGSVYWEAKDNMALAAKILTALPSEDQQTLDILKKYNIRFIALTPQVPCASYYGLMGRREQMRETLEARILRGEAPSWIKVLIKIPDPWPGILLAEVTSDKWSSPKNFPKSEEKPKGEKDNNPFTLIPSTTPLMGN